MDEICSYSVLDFVRTQEKSELCKILFLASITISSDEVLKYFSNDIKEYFAERVTGLMLVYPNCIINLVESRENEIFQVCSYFINAEPKFVGNSKCFPMEIDAEERFFEKWYARKAVDNCEKMNELDCENFEILTEIYCKLSDDFYHLCNELRDAGRINRNCLADKLDNLGSSGDSHVPNEKTLRALLESSWGDSLEKLVDNYWNKVCSREIDEEIWPFPENQCPAIETIDQLNIGDN